MTRKLKPYIIAETAYNHEGSLDYLFKMVDDIAQLKLNAIKFHLLLNVHSYITASHNLFPKYKEWLFTVKEWDSVIKCSKSKGLDVVALCDDVESLKFINKKHRNIFAVELHAVSLGDLFMLQEAAKFPGKIILGVGGSTLDEIHYAIDILAENKKRDILLMYGFQCYPTDYAEINLSRMLKINKLFDLPIGYADHTSYDDLNNEIVSCMAAMEGINILEKHYTPDQGKQRIDFQSAVGSEKMIKIKDLMALALKVYGNGDMRMSKAELNYGEIGPMKKAIVALKNIKKGEQITMGNIWFKRTGEISSLKQNQLFSIIGLKASRNIRRDETVDFNKLKAASAKKQYTDYKNMFVSKTKK